MVLYTVALIVHAIICIALVLVILAQTSKGGLDASLGGAAMNVFGGSGASSFLKKWTQILALLFVASCLLLAFLVKNIHSGGNSGVIERQKRLKDTEQQAPAKAPATAPVQSPVTE
ncbi:MAG: preprotein translocase subunit SecG [Candidatus Cloacimonetes bacterium]|nr:preprotein translocase subunit SecG [Candidatus Cloacimonadota bacterium]